MLRTVFVFILALGAGVFGAAQTNSTNPNAAKERAWKEYVYPTDRFAVTLPEAPNPHKNSQVPNTTTYSVSGVSLHVTNTPSGCSYAISEQLRGIEEVKSGKRKLTPPESQFQVNFSSIKKGTLDGYPYFEFEQIVRSSLMDYERWYCADKKLYIFTATWPIGQKKPPTIDRIVRSFRLIK